MSQAEVVVTGVGLVTPLGATAADSLRAWRAGGAAARRRLAELAGTRFEALEVAAPPKLDAAARLGSRKMLKYMSEAAALGCVAAHEAAAEAGLAARFDPDRVGLYSGTGLTAASLADALPAIRASLDEGGRLSCRLLGERGLAAANPLLSFRILPNMPGCLISIVENVRGPNYIFTPWEGGSGAALVEAWSAVASGEVEAALCGGADCPVHPATVVHLARTGMLAGGEFAAAAAGYLVLERAESAARDGRRVRAALLGAELVPGDRRAADPLAARMGRSYAAAPAVLLALASLSCGGEFLEVGGTLADETRERFISEGCSRPRSGVTGEQIQPCPPSAARVESRPQLPGTPSPASLASRIRISISGVDRQRFRAELEARP